MSSRLKVCSKCGVMKSATAYHFYRDKRRKDGLANPCKKCKKACEQTHQAKCLGRKRMLKYRYGISNQDYNGLFNDQNGKCKICGRHQAVFDYRLAVDHDHKTKEVRGLLCRYCNRLVGQYEKLKTCKNFDLLSRVVEYLGEISRSYKK